MWVFINHTVHVSVQTLTFNSAPCCLLLCRTSSCRLSLQPRWRRTLWASRRWRCRRRPARSRRWRASRTRRRTITWTSEPVRPETSCARSNWTRPGLLSQQGLTLPNLCTCLKENERYMSLQLSFPSHALPNWKKCSIVIACHVTDGALDGRLQSHSMSVNLCHLCISHFSLWSSPALWIWQQRLLAFTAFQSRVYASIFFFILMSCATCTSELQLNLRTGPSEVCTCSPPSFLFGMRRRIASEHDILQWTQRWHQDNRLHSSVEPHSLTTRSRLEMFTLNIWDVFQLALDCVLFLYSLYFL